MSKQEIADTNIYIFYQSTKHAEYCRHKLYTTDTMLLWFTVN